MNVPAWLIEFFLALAVLAVGGWLRLERSRREKQYDKLDQRVSEIERHSLLREEYREDQRYIRGRLDTITEAIVNGRQNG